MEKIFFILLILPFTLSSSSTVLLDKLWKLDFNNGEGIKLYPGVLSEINLTLSNTFFNFFKKDEIIYKLEIIKENDNIILTDTNLILNPKENLTYSTYIGLKCKDYKEKYKLYFSSYFKTSENSEFTNLKEFNLDLEIEEDDLTKLKLEPILSEMPGKSLNFFKIENELYNTDEINIIVKNLDEDEPFEFQNIIIKPYLERGELSEKNITNQGILFEYPFKAKKEYTDDKEYKFSLNFKDSIFKKCFKFDYDNEIEIKDESPVIIGEKVKTAIKYNTEVQTDQYKITNSIKIKTKIPVGPSIFSCEFIPSYSQSSSKFFKTFIKKESRLEIIVDNLEPNTEYYAFCNLTNTGIDEKTYNNISLSIGNFENADITTQLIPSNDENRIPQCARFYYSNKVDKEQRLKVKTLGTNYCYYLMKKGLQIFTPLPMIICESTEDTSEYITFCVAPLPLYYYGKYLTNKQKEDFNKLFKQFISDMKENINKYLDNVSFNKNVDQIVDIDISQSSIKVSYLNENYIDTNNKKIINFNITSSHKQSVQCFYNDDLSNNCKFSQLNSNIILNSKKSEIISVTITSPNQNQMYSLNIKCYNALPNFNYRYKTTGVISITYFNVNQDTDEMGKMSPSSPNFPENEDINTNTTINCNEKKNLLNPRCLIDKIVPIYEKITTYLPSIFKDIQNQVQQYSNMLTSQKSSYLKTLGKNIIPQTTDLYQNLTSIFEKIIEFTKYLTYTDCSVYSSGSSNKEKETIKNQNYVKCREIKQNYLEQIINNLKNNLQIFDCNSLNDAIISRLSDDAELNLKYVFMLINEMSNNPESYKKGLSQTLFNATLCIEENFDKYWPIVENQLQNKAYLNSSISAVKKDLTYILLQTLTNLGKVIHFDEIDGYIDSEKTKTGIIKNETYKNIQKKIIEFSKKLNDFGDELYSFSGSMISKIITYKESNTTLKNETVVISIPNKNILIRIYYNYMLKENNAKTLQVLVFDSPLLSIKSSEDDDKSSDSVNTFISIILYDEKGEEIPIKSINKEYRPEILYLKSKYKSLKKCFYYNENKNELETDGVAIDENHEYNGEKYIKCVSSHLTAFTAGTYKFNSNIPLWLALLIVGIIFGVLIGLITILIIVKKKNKNRLSYSKINSEFNKKDALIEY